MIMFLLRPYMHYLFILFIYLFIYLNLSLILPLRKSVRGEIVLITGASRGIGRFIAYEFAKCQSKLVLWATTKHGIEETAEECRKLGAEAYAFVVDCSKREEIYRAAEKVKSQVGDVSILVNNAGIVVAADLMATEDHEITKIFEVNILAHFWTTKAFLPAMMRVNHGHIVTVASAGGLKALPFLVSYCSSKFATVGFHETLTQELATLGNDGIKTSCFCSAGVNTGFVKNPSQRFLPLLEPEHVANILMEGILTNQKMIIVPPILKVTLMLERFLPECAVAGVRKLSEIKFDVAVGCRDKGK
uniref:Estradiol 17-beta-dehydrogenase 11 n=1 Tax=Sphenodon punctatus TaxID=8508 RepID=A0A8D0GZY4_SPHPU